MQFFFRFTHSQEFWKGMAKYGITLAIQIQALISTLTHSRGIFTMEEEDIAPYQDEDSRLHRAWLQSNVSVNTGEGMRSEPGSESHAARRACAVNHGEAVEHVGVREIVDIKGEHERDQA